MKKIIFVMPLMAMSLLACTKSNPYKIGEEDFYKAISYEGIEYLQCEGSGKDKPFTEMYSPTTYYCLSGTWHSYYIKKNGDSYSGLIKEDGSDKWETMDPDDAKEEFCTPSTGSTNTTYFIEKVGATYKDFKYQSDIKSYVYSLMGATALQYEFKNKKLVHFYTSEDEFSFDLTYNEVEPEPPAPTPSFSI